LPNDTGTTVCTFGTDFSSGDSSAVDGV